MNKRTSSVCGSNIDEIIITTYLLPACFGVFLFGVYPVKDL